MDIIDFSGFFKEQNNIKFVAETPPLLSDTSLLNVFSSLEEKESPQDLAAFINKSSDGVGATMFILNKRSRITHVTNKFILNSVSMESKERVQLIEAINSTTLNFFDSGLKQYNFVGSALDFASQDSENRGKYYHLSSLQTLYDNHLRGYQLLKSKSTAVLKVHNHLIYGYPIGMGSSISSQMAEMGSFQMGWVVIKHTRNLLGIVTDLDLTNMYLPRGNEITIPYLVNINEVLDVIDEFILTENYLEKDSEFITMLNGMGVSEIGSVSYAQLQSMGITSKNFEDLLLAKSLNLTNVLKKYLTDENSILFSRLKPFITSETAFDAFQAELTTSIKSMTTSYSEYLKFKEFLTILVSIRNDLTMFKIRLIY